MTEADNALNRAIFQRVPGLTAQQTKYVFELVKADRARLLRELAASEVLADEKYETDTLYARVLNAIAGRDEQMDSRNKAKAAIRTYLLGLADEEK